jgi:hypothetical protein
MRQPSPRNTDRTARTNGGDSRATENDPLLQSLSSGRRNVTETHAGSVRARRSSRSPTVPVNHHFGSADNQQQDQMNRALAVDPPERELTHGYDIHEDVSHADSSSRNSTTSSHRSLLMRRQHRKEKQEKLARETMYGDNAAPEHPPLLEIPEEVYGVRKAALQVLKPLTKTWVSGYKALKFSPIITFTKIRSLFSLFFLSSLSAGCIRWLCPHSPFWNGKMDSITTGPPLLVHSFTFLAIACRALLVPLDVSKGAIHIHCGCK